MKLSFKKFLKENFDKNSLIEYRYNEDKIASIEDELDLLRHREKDIHAKMEKITDQESDMYLELDSLLDDILAEIESLENDLIILKK